jgi:mannose/fructose-specific phosphotransferase system component IIA
VVVLGVGRAPAALVEAAETLLGPQELLSAASVPPDAPFPAVEALVRAETERADRGAGVLLLVDLFGSSLANACLAVARERPALAVLSGVNLAMLVKLSHAARQRVTPTALAEELLATGRRGIVLGEVDAAAEARHG